MTKVNCIKEGGIFIALAAAVFFIYGVSTKNKTALAVSAPILAAGLMFAAHKIRKHLKSAETESEASESTAFFNQEKSERQKVLLQSPDVKVTTSLFSVV